MIVFDLICGESHTFEGWFGSSDDYASQCADGLLSCPQCGSPNVTKAPMAPAVPAKGNMRDDNATPVTDAAEAEETKTAPLPAPSKQTAPMPSSDDAHPVASSPMPEEVQKALTALANAQEKALKQSTWVGDQFAEASRAMHYGEADEKPIHGSASKEEAEALTDEGIAVAALPFPVAPPEDLN